MNVLIHKNDNRITIHWRLLTGVSALVLAAHISSAGVAKADDATRPLIWFELDGQFSQQENNATLFNPPFLSASAFDGISHLNLEKSAPKIWDTGAKITFQPDGSDWILSLSARYGKAGRKGVRDVHPSLGTAAYYSAYQHLAAQSSEEHVIADFQAGRDFGLGKFGSNGSSVISAGVRIAQFNSRTDVDIKSQPTNLPTGYDLVHKFHGTFAATRKFSGIGPSLSWDASATIAGNSSAENITLDWGINGALLFGRQRSATKHQTAEYRYFFFTKSGTSYHTVKSAARSKNVTVPNLGGFAGVSWRYADAKISVGYRADMFFGAIDGGIDARKEENRSFFGPFASISVGIGN